MRILVIFLVLNLPLLSLAEEARIGRLFFTPSDRANMEIIRKNSKAPDKVVKAEDIEEVAAEEDAPIAKKVSPPVVVNGYISRSDGKNTVWVNDRPMSEKSSSQTVKVEKLRADKGQVKIVITDEKKAASLRPGQVYDPNSNKVYNHLREVPRVEPEEESESVADKISDKVGEGVDELKKKVIDLFAKPNPAPASSEN
ncbi:MAG: hypothetical protein ACKVN9_06415 [Methylophilaceae bacterium]